MHDCNNADIMIERILRDLCQILNYFSLKYFGLDVSCGKILCVFCLWLNRSSKFGLYYFSPLYVYLGDSFLVLIKFIIYKKIADIMIAVN